MKVGGIPITRCEEVLVLPRTNGPDLVFIAEAAIGWEDDFITLCPKPVAPVRVTKDGKQEHHSQAYMDMLEDWGLKRYNYMILRSLEPSNIEWDKVDLDRSETWNKWQDDFRDAGLCDNEIIRIQKLVQAANSLDERKLNAAREVFVLGREAEKQAASSGQNTEQSSM